LLRKINFLFPFVRVPSKTRTSALKLFSLILNVFQQEQCNTVNHFILDSMINKDEMIHCVTLLVGKRSIMRSLRSKKKEYSSFSPVSLSEFII